MTKPQVDDTVEVPRWLLRQAVALMSYDAKRGYESSATSYADPRHATSRHMAGYTDMDYTDYPDVSVSFPERLFEDVEVPDEE